MSIRPGEVLSGRYLLEDLLDESRGARFWRAYDRALARQVAIHVIPADDPRSAGLVAAAQGSAQVADRHFLRVLDADTDQGLTFVVNEWGSGTSLDILLDTNGPLDPRRAAWLTAELAEAIAAAHDAGVSHGRLTPESVLLDQWGAVRIIGLALDAALHGLPPGRRSTDLVDLVAVLYAGLTGRWAGISPSHVPPARVEGGRVLRPRRVRAGIPRQLDLICAAGLDLAAPGTAGHARWRAASASDLEAQLRAYVGDPTGLAIPGRAPQRWAPDPAHGPPDREAGPAPPEDRPAPARPEEPPEPTVDEGPPTVPTPAVDLPTSAGMPVFGTDGEVDWVTARAVPPPPPPRFEPPAERPLFAPDPPPGRPVRTARPGTAAATARPGPAPERRETGSSEFWPWTTSGGPGTGTGPVADPEPVPGRSWLRLALLIAVAAAVLLAIVVLSTLSRHDSDTGSGPAPGQVAR